MSNSKVIPLRYIWFLNTISETVFKVIKIPTHALILPCGVSVKELDSGQNGNEIINGIIARMMHHVIFRN